MIDPREDLKALITQGLEAKHDYGDGYAVAMIAEDLADALRDALAERDKALAIIADARNQVRAGISERALMKLLELSPATSGGES